MKMIYQEMTRLVKFEFLFKIVLIIQVFSKLSTLLTQILGNWHINKIFKIESSEPLNEKEAPKNLGELYLQVMFTKKGYIADVKEPELLEDLKASLAAEVAQIDGRLILNINHAKNLYANDTTTSDPYCKIILPGGVKEETPYIAKTLTPIWKYKNNFKISVAKNVKLLFI